MIYHICRQKDWERAVQEGAYQPPSLEEEGFIHASRKEQLSGVAERYFQGQVDLVLLAIDTARLTSRVQDDPVEGDFYPHIYGPINLEAVLGVTTFSPGEMGI